MLSLNTARMSIQSVLVLGTDQSGKPSLTHIGDASFENVLATMFAGALVPPTATAKTETLPPVTKSPPQIAAPKTTTVSAPSNLDRMTVEELKQFARSNDISLAGKGKKGEEQHARILRRVKAAVNGTDSTPTVSAPPAPTAKPAAPNGGGFRKPAPKLDSDDKESGANFQNEGVDISDLGYWAVVKSGKELKNETEVIAYKVISDKVYRVIKPSKEQPHLAKGIVMGGCWNVPVERFVKMLDNKRDYLGS